MSDSDLNIHCWILGEPYKHIVPVKISRNAPVANLKVAIRDAAHPSRLERISPATLILYRVSIPHTPQLAEHAAALELHELEMDSTDELSDVFANGLLRKHVHVIVEIPSGAWVRRFVIVTPTCFVDTQVPPREFLVFEYSPQSLTLHCRTTIQKAKAGL